LLNEPYAWVLTVKLDLHYWPTW